MCIRDRYACQGINGRFASFDAATQRFVVAPGADVATAEREHMCSLMELGFLFRRVQAHLTAARSERGAVRQALVACLGQECKDFYRFMALLQVGSWAHGVDGLSSHTCCRCGAAAVERVPACSDEHVCMALRVCMCVCMFR
eukprot:244007-Chlamydomonas_euryale.AAC.1